MQGNPYYESIEPYEVSVPISLFYANPGAYPGLLIIVPSSLPFWCTYISPGSKNVYLQYAELVPFHVSIVRGVWVIPYCPGYHGHSFSIRECVHSILAIVIISVPVVSFPKTDR